VVLKMWQQLRLWFLDRRMQKQLASIDRSVAEVEAAMYSTWMTGVEQHFEFLTGGLSVHDVDGFSARDLYEADMSPKEAAAQAVKDDELASRLVVARYNAAHPGEELTLE